MPDELVHLAVAGGVATITLDSPHNRNALSRQLVSELDQRLDAALADDNARVIVLTHEGPAFCAGADLKEQRSANESQQPGATRVDLPAILMKMWNAPKPVLGRLSGPARAGGIGLVAACDIAVAADTVTFAFSEVRIGVVPAVISVVVVPKIGEPKAMELFLTGDTIDAQTAAGIGLINRAAPADGLDDAVGQYLDSLLKGGPNALGGCKQLVRDVPKLSMEEGFREMSDRSAAFFASEEAREGMTAFAEKRPPSWVTGG